MAERRRSVYGDTRKAVMAQLLKHGPITAAEIAEELGISAAGVRRHLDHLVEESLAETCPARQVAGEKPARGRPATHYQLTGRGRHEFGDAYDEIALAAMDVIAELGGQVAVEEFARRRAERILADVKPVAQVALVARDEPAGEARVGDGDSAAEDIESVDEAVRAAEVERVARDVAAALERSGYAATVTSAGGGIQICQHHCPISAVAAVHPELCEAEHEAIAERVGRHVQSLALIPDGHGVCTTNIPLVAARGRGGGARGARAPVPRDPAVVKRK